MGDSSLKTKTVSSLFWSFLDKFGQQLLNFLSMLILMNILSTEDYGMVGALTIFVAFSSLLIDSGFGRALLNRKKLSTHDYTSVFYFNVGLSAVLYVLLFLCAPFLGQLFESSQIVPVARWLFVALLFNAFGLIQQTLLTKQADFKTLTRTNLVALLIANIVAVWMALNRMGVWALVCQQVLYALSRSVLLWVQSTWRPTGGFRLQSLRQFVGFSNQLLATSILGAAINNIYPSLIGVFYPMSQVAYFNQAKKYQDIPFLTLSNTFRSVSMLILSEINQQDERLRRVVSKLIKSIAFVAFPVGVWMMVIAYPMFDILFGNKWLDAVPYFRVLVIAGAFSPFILIFNELYIAKERSRYFMGIEIGKAVLLMVLIVAWFRMGVIGLAYSWIMYSVITAFASAQLSYKLIGYHAWHFVRDMVPYLLVALVSGLLAHIISQYLHNPWVLVIVQSAIVLAVYILVCRCLKLEMINEINQWLHKK